MARVLPFRDVAVMTAADDNVAIARHPLEPGTAIQTGSETWDVPYLVLEGHRFAVRPIKKDNALLSWGLSFGTALRDIRPGEYVSNQRMLDALPAMGVNRGLPASPNFEDNRIDFRLEKDAFGAGEQVPLHENPGCFEGFARTGNRGVGTRNFVILLGTSSRVGAFARAAANRLNDAATHMPNVDGVVAVTHTEGGMRHRPNNTAELLPALAGFFVHANVGAVLALDYGDEPIRNDVLVAFMKKRGDPVGDVAHGLLSLADVEGDPVDAIVAAGERLLPAADRFTRAPQPLAGLKLALQCGGSDGFSAVSANPLLAQVAKELIRHGGSACIAETTELIGAEPYMLASVADVDTAERFLKTIEDYRELAGRHGHTPEGNPSGGNRFRGLYNIIVKSIGAALKKAPDVRLDAVLEYGEPMGEPGFYFMDTPGNDLESIAGQVAGGCNLIAFTTGNGSITNFPFVPTIKIVSTTGRYQMLKREMDINAGEILDGRPLGEASAVAFQQLIRVTEGLRTAGERAGHSQVQIWRNWEQDGSRTPASVASSEQFTEQPLPVLAGDTIRIARPRKGRRVSLILPNSLCSGQVACTIARRMEADTAGAAGRQPRIVALPHTEGCGCHAAESGDLAARTLLNYVLHPSVESALFLEHGCEKYQNTFFESLLGDRGVDGKRYGWASIQQDGGIRSVSEKIASWFATKHPEPPAPAGKDALDLGLYATAAVPGHAAAALAILCRSVVEAGGSVVVPATSTLLATPAFLKAVFPLHEEPAPSLPYGVPPTRPGVHVMDVPTDDDLDTVSGLGATGVEVMVAMTGAHPLQAHPLIPIIQAADGPDRDFQFAQGESARDDARLLYALCCRCFTGDYVPPMLEKGLTAFQLSRGRLGISL